METWHKHTSSLRNERSGRRSRPQSERRNNYRTRAKRTTRRTVGLCDGMFLLLCATCTTRWPMTSRHWRGEYGQKIDGLSVPFGTLVEYIPITAKDKSGVHQFGKTTLKGIFLGCVPRAGGGWSGDLMTADYADLHESEASGIYVLQTEPLAFLIVQDRHCQQRETSNPKMMRKSKKATTREAQQKIRGLWVENLFIDIMKNVVWSFTTQIMKHSRSHWYIST